MLCEASESSRGQRKASWKTPENVDIKQHLEIMRGPKETPQDAFLRQRERTVGDEHVTQRIHDAP